MADAHANFSYSTVATAPSPATSGTSLTVQAGDGTKFPTPPFNMIVCPAGTAPTAANAEIVRVTARSTDTFTITRTQESTTARTIVLGDQVYSGFTAKSFTDVETLPVGGVLSGSLPNPVMATGTSGLAAESFSVYRNAAATVANGAVVPFDTREFDVSSRVDITTNKGRFTPQVAGYYRLSAAVAFTAASVPGTTDYVRAGINKNGSTVKLGAFQFGSAGVTNIGQQSSVVHAQVQANGTTDYFEVSVSSTNTITLVLTTTGTRFDGALIGKS